MGCSCANKGAGARLSCPQWERWPCFCPAVPLLPHGTACKAVARLGSLAWTKYGWADSPVWEISKEAASFKPHFHLTSLNILQFQNTYLKITYRNIYMDTERNFPALGIQSAAHGRSRNCLPAQSLFACYWASCFGSIWVSFSLSYLASLHPASGTKRVLLQWGQGWYCRIVFLTVTIIV